MHGIDRRLLLGAFAAAATGTAPACAGVARASGGGAHIRRLSEFAWGIGRHRMSPAEAIIVTTPALLETVVGPWVRNGAARLSDPRGFGAPEEADFAPESQESARIAISAAAATECLERAACDPRVAHYLLGRQAEAGPRLFALGSFLAIDDIVPWLRFDRLRQQELVRRTFGGAARGAPRLAVVLDASNPVADYLAAIARGSSYRLIILPGARPGVLPSGAEKPTDVPIATQLLTLWPLKV